MAELALANALQRMGRLRKLLLPALFLLSFGLFLILTFPFEEVARRLEIEALRNGLELRVGSLSSSGFFGLRARDVTAKPAVAEGPAPELRLELIDLSPDLLGLILRRTGFGYSLRAYGGTAKGHAQLASGAQQGLSALSLDARDLDLHLLPLAQLADAEVTGKLALKADLPVLAPVEVAAGAITVALQNGVLVKGNVKGFTLPKVSLGNVEGLISVEKGIAKFDKFGARGGDVEADVEGTVRLRPLISLSQADLHVRLRPSDHWLEANPMIKSVIGMLGPKQADGWTVTISGPLSNLNARPGR